MKILCFGDSNTYGYDPRSFFGGRYEPEDRWPDHLAAQTSWEIINQGSCGREIPRNLSSAPELASVDIFLVMLGTNNLLQGASAEEAAARMETFLISLIPHCNKILLISPPTMKRGAWVPTDGLVRESIRLADEYRSLAETLHIPFVDTTDWNIELAFDGVHFTEAGHHTFAMELEKHLKKLIPSLDSHPAS